MNLESSQGIFARFHHVGPNTALLSLKPHEVESSWTREAREEVLGAGWSEAEFVGGWALAEETDGIRGWLPLDRSGRTGSAVGS